MNDEDSPDAKDIGPADIDEIDPEDIKAFFELQKLEVQAKLADTKARSEDLQNQKEIALRSIEAQAQDRNEMRGTYERDSRFRQIVALIALVLLIAFFVMLVALDEAPMAQKIIEVVVYAVLGAFGGYGYAVKKQKDENQED